MTTKAIDLLCIRCGYVESRHWDGRCPEYSGELGLFESSGDVFADIGAAAEGPQDAWKCFHCEEVFTDRAEAQAHFGEDQTGTTAQGETACRVAASEGGLLKALRESEREVGSLRHQADQLEYDAAAYEMMTAELTRRFGIGVRTPYQAWLKLEAMESRAMAAEEQLRAALAGERTSAGTEGDEQKV